MLLVRCLAGLDAALNACGSVLVLFPQANSREVSEYSSTINHKEVLRNIFLFITFFVIYILEFCMYDIRLALGLYKGKRYILGFKTYPKRMARFRISRTLVPCSNPQTPWKSEERICKFQMEAWSDRSECRRM